MRLANQPELDEEKRAELLNKHGERQSALGEYKKALASATEAVKIYRTLAEKNPDAYPYLPALAMSLNTLGKQQSALRQHEEALASTAEAVRIYRKLAGKKP